jgi:hypothetical protein
LKPKFHTVGDNKNHRAWNKPTEIWLARQGRTVDAITAGQRSVSSLGKEQNFMSHRKLAIRFRTAAALLLLAGLVIPMAQAKPKDKSKNPQQGKAVGIYLIGHLPLPNTFVSNIVPVSDPDRQLIQLIDNVHGMLTVVDVGNAAQPKFREQVRLPAELAQSHVETRVGDAMLLSVSQGDGSAHGDPQSLSLISFADPSNPKTVQKFEGVTALWNDGRRELIYLANADGLWILESYSAADKRMEAEFDKMLYQ